MGKVVKETSKETALAFYVPKDPKKHTKKSRKHDVEYLFPTKGYVREKRMDETLKGYSERNVTTLQK